MNNLKSLQTSLKENIKNFYNGVELTGEQNATQLRILADFLKYTVMAQNLLRFQQGTNYDTATFNDSYSLYFKEYQNNKARTQNIFSSSEDYINNSFIGIL